MTQTSLPLNAFPLTQQEIDLYRKGELEVEGSVFDRLYEYYCNSNEMPLWRREGARRRSLSVDRASVGFRPVMEWDDSTDDIHNPWWTPVQPYAPRLPSRPTSAPVPTTTTPRKPPKTVKTRITRSLGLSKGRVGVAR